MTDNSEAPDVAQAVRYKKPKILTVDLPLSQGLRTRIRRLGALGKAGLPPNAVGLARDRVPSGAAIVRIPRPLQGRPRQARPPRHCLLHSQRPRLDPRPFRRVAGSAARTRADP